MSRNILFLSLLSFGQFLLVHFFLIQGFPNSADEQAYLYQARLLSRGQLYVEDPIYDRANPLNKYVEAEAMDDTAGRRFSKYDPGWPALLSLGTRLRVEWLVAPLLGTLTVFLLLSYVRRRIGDEFVATTWWLVTLCAFFSFNVANFGSHTSTMAFLVGAFVLYDDTLERRQSKGSPGRLFLVGVLLGYCSLIRSLDWIPLTGWIAFDLLRRRKLKGLVLVLLGCGLLASVRFPYNKILTGNALLPPATHYARGDPLGGLGIQWEGFKWSAIRLLRVLYIFPPTILLALTRSWNGNLKTYLLLFALNMCAYFFYPWSVGGPGPRYYFPYFPFLILAVVELYRLNRNRIGQKGWSLAMACLVVCSFAYGNGQTRVIYKLRDLERTVGTIPEKKKVILLQTGAYDVEIPNLIRNPPDLWSADTVYLAYGDGVRIAELLKRFPEHSVYVYRYPGSLQPWKG